MMLILAVLVLAAVVVAVLAGRSRRSWPSEPAGTFAAADHARAAYVRPPRTLPREVSW